MVYEGLKNSIIVGFSQKEVFSPGKRGFSGYSLAVVCVISLGKKGGGKGRLCLPAREI